MKDLEEAAEEQNPLGLLPPNSDEDESVGASSTYGYTVTIPSKGDWAFLSSQMIGLFFEFSDFLLFSEKMTIEIKGLSSELIKLAGNELSNPGGNSNGMCYRLQP